MVFDFDRIIERRGSDSKKWRRYAGTDILPMWIADMDFAAPPAVLEALQARIAHGVFGYASPWPSLLEAIQAHLLRHHGWAIEASWIVWIPGLVAALNVACRAVGRAGDAVFTATPVYPPFLSAPTNARRRLVTAPLWRGPNRWEWDFDASARTIATAAARLWLLCHPHNPVGRAWTAAEMDQIAAVAEHGDMVVCSDEVHGGLLLDPAKRHQPLATHSPEMARRTITLLSPSKAYNLPALCSAFAVIPDARLRRRFLGAMAGIMPHVNVLGLTATEVALRDCDDWHQALITYLRGNARYLEAGIAGISGLSTTPVEAGYLAWIDARGLNVGQPQRHFEAHGLGLSDGGEFGMPGFVRLNFGCPRPTLALALARLSAACDPCG